MSLKLVPCAFDSLDARRLIEEVQQEYVVRYGDEDLTPVDPAEFAPPLGYFVVGYLDGAPVACGGWRVHDAADSAEFLDGDAEIKRMYVAPEVRGKGFARQVLAELERSAAVTGRRRMILETGTSQPEAIALYISSGYTRIPAFGHYKWSPLNRCFAKPLAIDNSQ